MEFVMGLAKACQKFTLCGFRFLEFAFLAKDEGQAIQTWSQVWIIIGQSPSVDVQRLAIYCFCLRRLSFVVKDAGQNHKRSSKLRIIAADQPAALGHYLTRQRLRIGPSVSVLILDN